MVEKKTKRKKRKQQQRDTLDWSPDLSKLAAPGIDFHLVPAFAERPVTREVDDERLKAAYVAMAEIVTTYGETYLPIFQRLHDELEARRSEKTMMNVAKEISNNKINKTA